MTWAESIFIRFINRFLFALFFIIHVYFIYFNKKNSKPKFEKRISEVHQKEQKTLTYFQEKVSI